MQLTVRIELGDTDYAIVLSEMRHRTTKLVRQALQKCLKPRGKPILLSEIKTGAELLTEAEIDFEKLDSDQNAEIILLNQTTEWSFGEVNQETLDNIPTSKYEKLIAEVDKLYSQPPLASKS